MGNWNLEMIVWECGLEFYCDYTQFQIVISKLNFEFLHFYPSTLTTLVLGFGLWALGLKML
jgi:hypothetical protein